MVLRAMSLASGELAAAEATLFSALTLKRTIANITCFNGHVASVTVTLKVQRSGGTARVVVRQVLGADETLAFGPVELSEGDAIRGLASVASVVDYTITGLVEVMT